MEINNLFDLNSLRSAPQLNKKQIKKLQNELDENIKNSDSYFCQAPIIDWEFKN